jgi:NTE family protein
MQINGVFEGGGVKGIALVGAIAAAEQAGMYFHQVAGTSAGALVAALLAAGYSAAELKQILANTDFRQFIRPTWLHKIKGVGPFARLLWKQGMYSPDPLEQWLVTLLKMRGVNTFADLATHRLRVIASDISRGKLLTLPTDLPDYGIEPDSFSIARAVSLSTRIPYYFDPGQIDGSTIVDGALLSNFPVWIFDTTEQKVRDYVPTIGFQLYNRAATRKHQIKGPLSMFKAMFETMMTAHDRMAIADDQKFRAIYIPSHGIGTTQFDISKQQRMTLYDAGYVAGSAFFRNWNTASYHKDYVRQVAARIAQQETHLQAR